MMSNGGNKTVEGPAGGAAGGAAGANDERKRMLSPGVSTGVSPDAKRLFIERVRPRKIPRKLPMPDDNASSNEWFKSLFEKFDDMWEMYDELNSSIEYYFNELNDCKQKLSDTEKECDTLNKRMTQLENENHELSKQMTTMQEQNLKAEVHRRELNLIFQGVPDTYGESDVLMHNKMVNIFNHMEVFNRCGARVPIVKLQRLGPFQRDRIRPVLCQFLRYSDVNLILRNRGQLPNEVFVQEDYPLEIEERRRTLRPIFNKAKNMPQYKGKCRLTVDKLVLKGQTFTFKPVNNLDKLPNELSPRKAAERENDKILAFFTRGSPFSNFHPSEFVKQSVKYSCNEQFIQASKAELFDDDFTHAQIMKTKCPYEMKRLGNTVQNFERPKWTNVAQKVALEACMEKFSQNHELRNALMETGDKILVEASTDRFWGVGISLHDRNILNDSSWTGKNVLGQVLTQVREHLK